MRIFRHSLPARAEWPFGQVPFRVIDPVAAADSSLTFQNLGIARSLSHAVNTCCRYRILDKLEENLFNTRAGQLYIVTSVKKYVYAVDPASYVSLRFDISALVRDASFFLYFLANSEPLIGPLLIGEQHPLESVSLS